MERSYVEAFDLDSSVRDCGQMGLYNSSTSLCAESMLLVRTITRYSNFQGLNDDEL